MLCELHGLPVLYGNLFPLQLNIMVWKSHATVATGHRDATPAQLGEIKKNPSMQSIYKVKNVG